MSEDSRQALADPSAMLRIRAFEEQVREMRLAGDIAGSVHLCIGQEAGPVGACAVLEQHDALFATYRGHGWALARGVPADAVFAELLGKASGVNGGRGGSAYFTAPEHAAAYGLPGRRVDGNTPEEVREPVREAVTPGPGKRRAVAAGADDRAPCRALHRRCRAVSQARGKRQGARSREPIVRLRSHLLARGIPDSELDDRPTTLC